MARSLFIAIVTALLWIVWCVLVVTEVVPALRRHVTMWPWLMAYVLCLVPLVALAFVTIFTTRQKS